MKGVFKILSISHYCQNCIYICMFACLSQSTACPVVPLYVDIKWCIKPLSNNEVVLLIALLEQIECIMGKKSLMLALTFNATVCLYRGILESPCRSVRWLVASLVCLPTLKFACNIIISLQCLTVLYWNFAHVFMAIVLGLTASFISLSWISSKFCLHWTKKFLKVCIER